MSHPSENKRGYWFPAKRYGWGWGFPSTWQGWGVLVLYLGSLLLIAYVFPPDDKTTSFVLATLAVSLLLLVVCWIKGEPPAWRWGKR